MHGAREKKNKQTWTDTYQQYVGVEEQEVKSMYEIDPTWTSEGWDNAHDLSQQINDTISERDDKLKDLQL